MSNTSHATPMRSIRVVLIVCLAVVVLLVAFIALRANWRTEHTIYTEHTFANPEDFIILNDGSYVMPHGLMELLDSCTQSTTPVGEDTAILYNVTKEQIEPYLPDIVKLREVSEIYGILYISYDSEPGFYTVLSFFADGTLHSKSAYDRLNRISYSFMPNTDFTVEYAW